MASYVNQCKTTKMETRDSYPTKTVNPHTADCDAYILSGEKKLTLKQDMRCMFIQSVKLDRLCVVKTTLFIVSSYGVWFVK